MDSLSLGCVYEFTLSSTTSLSVTILCVLRLMDTEFWDTVLWGSLLGFYGVFLLRLYLNFHFPCLFIPFSSSFSWSFFCCCCWSVSIMTYIQPLSSWFIFSFSMYIDILFNTSDTILITIGIKSPQGILQTSSFFEEFYCLEERIPFTQLTKNFLRS